MSECKHNFKYDRDMGTKECVYCMLTLDEYVAELEAENGRLRAALEMYGQHKPECTIYFHDRGCDCGFVELCQSAPMSEPKCAYCDEPTYTAIGGYQLCLHHAIPIEARIDAFIEVNFKTTKELQQWVEEKFPQIFAP